MFEGKPLFMRMAVTEVADKGEGLSEVTCRDTAFSSKLQFITKKGCIKEGWKVDVRLDWNPDKKHRSRR